MKMNHFRRILTVSLAATRQRMKVNCVPPSQRLIWKHSNVNDKLLCCALHTQSLRHSQSWLKIETRKEYALTAEEFKKAVDDDSVYVVDVREPFEVANGRVPAKQYVNIPLGFIFFALRMPDDTFQKKFGVRKPATDENMVFMCHSGVRSTFALQAGQELNYKNSKHYSGGWAGWLKNFPEDIQK